MTKPARTILRRDWRLKPWFFCDTYSRRYCRNVVVFGADGAEFEHFSGQAQKKLKRENCQKLFPIPNRAALICISGQNSIVPVGVPVNSQELVGPWAMRAFPTAIAAETIESVARELHRLVSPHIENTYAELSRSGIRGGTLKIFVAGLDSGLRSPTCWETVWHHPAENLSASVNRIENPKEPVTILHDGSAAHYAITAIGGPNGANHPNQLRLSPSVASIEAYIRNVYRKSLAIQESQAASSTREFGGIYHQATIRSGSTDCVLTFPAL